MSDRVNDGPRVAPADATQQRAFLCLSCNACRASCSINTATGRLQPLKLVRASNLGMGPLLPRLPEVWYCLQCQRCAGACPVQASPASLVRELRRAEACRDLDGQRLLEAHEALCAILHRARRLMVIRCLEGDDQEPDLDADLDAVWDATLAEAPDEPLRPGRDGAQGLLADLDRDLGHSHESKDLGRLRACATCCECTTTCPVAHERAVFDPVAVFRMAAHGLDEELLGAPDIWLCLGCQGCTAACAQGVEGHRIIEALQNLAVRRGAAPAQMPAILEEINQACYARFIREVDALLG